MVRVCVVMFLFVFQFFVCLGFANLDCLPLIYFTENVVYQK